VTPPPRPFPSGALPSPGVASAAASSSGAPLAKGPASASGAAPPAPNPEDPTLDPVLTREFRDAFDRVQLGADWSTTSAEWRIEGGRLCVQNARNHPAWLRRRLPTNARIEFDATSSSPDGDMKAEYWGDGRSAAQTISYNAATSYLTIFGGWKNQFHVLARIDEHARNRPEVRIDDSSDDIRARRVEPNRAYHFKVMRDDGKTVRWYVDDIEILTYPDPEPLRSHGHDHFGFNDWEVRACFDNLVIVPLP
jgi:hypothetical protein